MMVVRSVAGDRILVASLDRCVYEWLRILEDTALGLRTLRDHVVSYNLNKTYIQRRGIQNNADHQMPQPDPCTHGQLTATPAAS